VAEIRIVIRVRPGSSRLRVGGSYGPDGQLVVAVHAAPVDGAANEAVLQALATALGLRPRQVRIVSGATSRTKVVGVTVEDAEAHDLGERVQALRDGAGKADPERRD
jgi:uncharacterized protein YggU (UPF0235/DUF167 family)